MMTNALADDSVHTLLIVGDGDVATALEATASTLGWNPVVVTTLPETTEALSGSRSVVVVSHHDGLDGPALAAALSSDAAYVAAMGSRTTQARRRSWLLENGVPESRVDDIRGPAGLDIGAKTPAEIAVSILAEIIAVSHGVSGGAIVDRPGPVHP